jgi:lysophospholipase L1-like esterase
VSLLVPNHHVIVPETQDLVIQTTSIQSQEQDRIYIELFGDSIMCGRDPDAMDPICGVCNSADPSSARVAHPPGNLLELFLPQYKLVITTRSSGNSTAEQLLKGTDGVNDKWPDNIEANIVVINHGMNDARKGVPIQRYKNNLIELRSALKDDQIMVWQTPTVNKLWNTDPYAEAMREVAEQYGDLVADANSVMTNWLEKLPDGVHPRQLGYVELVDLCLSSKINSAILRRLGTGYTPHKYYRKEYQEKFILEDQNEIQLSFKPLVHKWVEVYLRDNLSFTAVSRGFRDLSGSLAAGLWNNTSGEQETQTTASYNLVRIRRSDGRIVFNKNYKTETDIKQTTALANDLNLTNNQYIVVVTTYGDPKTNRLTDVLAEAMYRCGASVEIFGSSLFKVRSAYILIGIPGCGTGNGIEAYSGMADGTDRATAITVGEPKPSLKYYSPGAPNVNWSELLNTYNVWQGNVSAEYNWQVLFPVPSIYTISVSADNTANVFIAANTMTSGNTTANLSFNKILETTGPNEVRFGTPQANSFTISTCGWYDIKINAEDFLDPLGAHGLAGIIEDQEGNVIWTTRNARNSKEVYEIPDRKTINPFDSYSEIEFSISSSGIPYAIDVFPPVPESLGSSGTIEKLLAKPYEFIANVPPINGTRLLNPKYATHETNGLPGSTYHITKDNKIKFSKKITGVVTVVSDTVETLSSNIALAKVENIHSLTTFVQRFNPARWAFSSNATVVIEDTGNLATRPANSAVGVNSLKLHNTQLRVRVGDSHYAEPIVLDQPQHGYVRITQDKKHMAYVPFPDYAGLDAFTYTLLSQTGQAGPPKSVYVEVTGNVSVYSPYVPTAPNVTLANAISINSFTVNEQSLYSIWVIAGTPAAEGKTVKLSLLDGTATPNTDYTPTITVSSNGGTTWSAYDASLLPTVRQGSLLARVPMIQSTAIELGESLVLSAEPEIGNIVVGTATINNAVGLIFNDDWTYPNSLVNAPTIIVTSNIVRESSPYAIWVVSGNPVSVGLQITLTLSGTATRGVDYSSTLQVSEDNGVTWANYQPNNVPHLINGVLLARVTMQADNLIEIGETIILSAGISGGSIARGTVVIDDLAGVIFTSAWSYNP